jgi:hypothetical protein
MSRHHAAGVKMLLEYHNHQLSGHYLTINMNNRNNTTLTHFPCGRRGGKGGEEMVEEESSLNELYIYKKNLVT